MTHTGETRIPATDLRVGDRVTNCSSYVSDVADLGEGAVFVTFAHSWATPYRAEGMVTVTNR